LEQAVAVQAGQGGVQSGSTKKNTQIQSETMAPSPANLPSNALKEAPLVAKPVEATVTSAEPVATPSPSHSALAIPQGQTQDAKESIKTTDFDLQAAYKENPKPSYPKAAFRVGAEGTVEVAVEVNPDGSVAAVRLVQSSGHESLDQSALDTIKGWRFRSARKDGVLSKSVVRVPITFRLRAAR
jgi:protein TonB